MSKVIKSYFEWVNKGRPKLEDDESWKFIMSGYTEYSMLIFDRISIGGTKGIHLNDKVEETNLT